MNNRYLDLLVELYLNHADPVQAAPMKKYMKDKFEYLGIPSGPRKEIYKEFFRVKGKPSLAETEGIIGDLWDMEAREYQYFGMTLMQKMEKNAGMEALPLFEFMIVNKSWWDTVDFIAANLAGPLLGRNRNDTSRVVTGWIDSGNMWLQRTALLFQLKFRETTDTDLLFSSIRKLKGRKEFFIRKAIGWALREYSKTNPKRVSDFVDRTELSPLSVNEAMKIIMKGK